MSSPTQFHYEIVVEIAHMSVRDINFCAFVRAPMVKQAGFAVLQLHLSQLMIRQMQSDIGKSYYPSVTVNIYVNNEIDDDKMDLLYVRTFKCIKLDMEGVLRFEEDREHVKLLLVHPTILYLANHNTFNKIFLDTTAYSVLKAYEGFLESTFGKIWQFNHLGINANQYIYEQLLTRSTNDLSIPDYLTYIYKMSNSFCFYFYDPFYIKDDAQNEVVNHYIDLLSRAMKRQDIRDYADTSLSVNFLRRKIISDIDQNFAITPKDRTVQYHRELLSGVDEITNTEEEDENIEEERTDFLGFPTGISEGLTSKRGHRKIQRHREMSAEYEKNPKQTSIEKKQCPIKEDIDLVTGNEENEGDRFVKGILEKRYYVYNYPGSSAVSRIYCPDTVANGLTRFKQGSSLMANIASFDYYEMSDCLVDFPQFGYLYNLESENPEEYLYTPISIVNIFQRKIHREHYLYHLAKTVMLRYVS